MKIAIDLDCTLADFHPPMIAFHNESYHTQHTLADYLKVYSYADVWGVPYGEMVERIMKFYYSPYMKAIKPVRGAIEAVKRLKKEHELYVITARPAEIKEITVSWVNNYFPKVFKDVIHTNLVLQKTHTYSLKSKVCLNLGAKVMIEDHVEYAIDCAESNIETYLLSFPSNQGTSHKNILRVKDWQELYATFKSKHGQTKRAGKSTSRNY